MGLEISRHGGRSCVKERPLEPIPHPAFTGHGKKADLAPYISRHVAGFTSPKRTGGPVPLVGNRYSIGLHGDTFQQVVPADGCLEIVHITRPQITNSPWRGALDEFDHMGVFHSSTRLQVRRPAVPVQIRQKTTAFLPEHDIQRLGDVLVACPAVGVECRPQIRHTSCDGSQTIRISGVRLLKRAKDMFVARPRIESRHCTPQQAAGPEWPALQRGNDGLPVVGIAPVEPPEKEQAVGVHVVGHGVEPPFRLLDHRVIVQSETQAGQAIEPIPSPFVRPGALVPE